MRRLLLAVDKMPDEQAPAQRRQEALFVYRKITALRCVRCCGLCGSFQHATKAFWCLGMRLCRHCVQTNLVSHLVLYERYWITLGRPVDTFHSFVEAVAMRVFYFRTRATPKQRMEFSCDRLDFPGGIHTVWFFWKPHLQEIMNMERLEREGSEKHAAARIVRAYARRMLILRAMRGTTPARHWIPTFAPSGVFTKKRDLRCVEQRLRRTELIDKNDLGFIQRTSCHPPAHLFTRLAAAEDRIIPFLFN